MSKAMAPMTGGRICPLVEATASTAAANLSVYPVRFISGIVRTPVDAAFAEGEPDTDPKSALATTAAFAGPPTLWPVRVIAMSRNHCPAPEALISAPKMMRSEERRVGQECVSSCRSRGPPDHSQKKCTQNTDTNI